MKNILIINLLFLTLAKSVIAAPVLYDSSYNIELLTTVTGSALHAMDISSDGRLFVSSYNDGKVFVVDSPSS